MVWINSAGVVFLNFCSSIGLESLEVKCGTCQNSVQGGECVKTCITLISFLQQLYQCCLLSSAGQNGSKGFLRISNLLSSAKLLFCHPVLCAVEDQLLALQQFRFPSFSWRSPPAADTLDDTFFYFHVIKKKFKKLKLFGLLCVYF